MKQTPAGLLFFTFFIWDSVFLLIFSVLCCCFFPVIGYIIE